MQRLLAILMGKYAETVASPVPYKTCKLPGALHPADGTEDGGSPGANKQLKKWRMASMIGLRTLLQLNLVVGSSLNLVVCSSFHWLLESEGLHVRVILA
jgi:hypothetical protein